MMGKINCLKAILVMVAAIFYLLVPAGISVAAGLSADYVLKEKGREKVNNARIYIKDDKIRQEIVMKRGVKQTVIIRQDKNVMWILMPKEKMYMEMPCKRGDKKFEKWSPEKYSKAKYLGKDTVAGLACKKYEITEKSEKIYFWISGKAPFPVKIESKNSSMEYKNIKEGNVPNSLFEIPPGYKKMSMPMMPGGVGFPK